MPEEEGQPRAADPLEPADHAHQPCEEALLPGPRQLSAPAPRDPDSVAPDDELQREQHRDDLEDMGRAAGGQRQRGHAEQQDEQQREALLLEQAGQAAERLLALAFEPALERLAHPRRAEARLG